MSEQLSLISLLIRRIVIITSTIISIILCAHISYYCRYSLSHTWQSMSEKHVARRADYGDKVDLEVAKKAVTYNPLMSIERILKTVNRLRANSANEFRPEIDQKTVVYTVISVRVRVESFKVQKSEATEIIYGFLYTTEKY